MKSGKYRKIICQHRNRFYLLILAFLWRTDRVMLECVLYTIIYGNIFDGNLSISCQKGCTGGR